MEQIVTLLWAALGLRGTEGRRTGGRTLAADVRLTASQDGQPAPRYVWIETGAAAEKIYRQAAALGLGTVLVGAFDGEAVERALGLPERLEPVVLMPVGTTDDGGR
ncbi:MAG: nitroreductase family protein [Candidatus Palauibacterales bacterium]|nr:nitroreductase family protein [Candidatus Palauibacterales bacterium]